MSTKMQKKDLPEVFLPTDPPKLAALSNLFLLLQAWNTNGAQPATFGDFRSHSLLQAEFEGVFMNLVGPELWAGWFGAWDPDPDNNNSPKVPMNDLEFIPRQSLAYMNTALLKMSNSFLQQEQAAKDQAKVTYKLMSEASKRRRQE